MSSRPALNDLAHNSSMEAMGFITLFMPSTIMEEVEKYLDKSPRWVTIMYPSFSKLDKFDKSSTARWRK